MLNDTILFGFLSVDRNGECHCKMLNSNYCKISGKCEEGLLFDFNYAYFRNNSIDDFPNHMKEEYLKIVNEYSSFIAAGGEVIWEYWKQVTNKDGFFCLKII